MKTNSHIDVLEVAAQALRNATALVEGALEREVRALETNRRREHRIRVNEIKANILTQKKKN